MQIRDGFYRLCQTQRNGVFDISSCYWKISYIYLIMEIVDIVIDRSVDKKICSIGHYNFMKLIPNKVFLLLENVIKSLEQISIIIPNLFAKPLLCFTLP